MNWCKATLNPSDGQEIVVRAREGAGSRWHYQIGVWLDGHFQNPTMGCELCGGKARFLPVVWNPFQSLTFEWLPLAKFLEMERRLEHALFEKDRMYDRVLRAEEVMYEAVINGNDNELIDYVNDGLEKI